MKYKWKIVSLLCSNEDILTMLNIPEEDKESNILYNYIYPYLYYPTQEETKCMIGFILDFPRIKKNEYFKESNLIIQVICHRNLMKTDLNGTRTDILEGLIVQMLNWRTDLGLELSLKSSVEKIISSDYHSRLLIFETLKFNSLDMGIKING